MIHPIRTVLWFNGRGREAAEFYCSLVPNSRILGSYASNNGGANGDMWFEVIDFTLNGAGYQILDAGPMFPLSNCVSVMLLTPIRPKPTGCARAGRRRRQPQRLRLADRPVRPVVAGHAGTGDAAADRPGPWPRRTRHAAVMTMTKLDLAAIEAAAEGTAP